MIDKENIPSLSIVIPIAPQSFEVESVSRIVKGIGKDVELILVFDGFGDELPKEFSSYNFSYSERIRILGTNSRNPGASRNLGLANSNGLWVAFWDSDDFVDLHEFEIAFSEELKSSSDIVIYDYMISRKSAKLESKVHETKIRHHGSINCVALTPGLWRMIFRRELIQNLKFSSACWGEDQLFFAQILKSNPVISFSEHAYYKYRVGFSNQLTSRKEFYQDLKAILDEIKYISTAIPIIFCLPLQIMSMKMSLTLIKFSSGKERLTQISRFVQTTLNQNRRINFQALCFVLLKRKCSG